MKIVWNAKQECVVTPESLEDKENLRKALAQLSQEYEDWDNKACTEEERE